MRQVHPEPRATGDRSMTTHAPHRTTPRALAIVGRVSVEDRRGRDPPSRGSSVIECGERVPLPGAPGRSWCAGAMGEKIVARCHEAPGSAWCAGAISEERVARCHGAPGSSWCAGAVGEDIVARCQDAGLGRRATWQSMNEAAANPRLANAHVAATRRGTEPDAPEPPRGTAGRAPGRALARIVLVRREVGRAAVVRRPE